MEGAVKSIRIVGVDGVVDISFEKLGEYMQEKILQVYGTEVQSMEKTSTSRQASLWWANRLNDTDADTIARLASDIAFTVHRDGYCILVKDEDRVSEILVKNFPGVDFSKVEQKINMEVNVVKAHVRQHSYYSNNTSAIIMEVLTESDKKSKEEELANLAAEWWAHEINISGDKRDKFLKLTVDYITAKLDKSGIVTMDNDLLQIDPASGLMNYVLKDDIIRTMQIGSVVSVKCRKKSDK